MTNPKVSYKKKNSKKVPDNRTFWSYDELCKLNEFTVYSPAIGKYFKYRWKEKK